MISKYGECEHYRILTQLYDDVFGLILALDTRLLSADGRCEVEAMIHNAARSLGVKLPKTPEISFNTFCSMFWGKFCSDVFSEMTGKRIDCGQQKIDSTLRSFCKHRCNQGELLKWAGLDEDIEKMPNPWFLLNSLCQNAPQPGRWTSGMLILFALGYPVVEDTFKVISPQKSRTTLWNIGDTYAFSEYEIFRIGYSSLSKVAVHESMTSVFNNKIAYIATGLTDRRRRGDILIDNPGELTQNGTETYGESIFEPVVDCVFVDFETPDVPEFMKYIFKIQ